MVSPATITSLMWEVNCGEMVALMTLTSLTIRTSGPTAAAQFATCLEGPPSQGSPGCKTRLTRAGSDIKAQAAEVVATAPTFGVVPRVSSPYEFQVTRYKHKSSRLESHCSQRLRSCFVIPYSALFTGGFHCCAICSRSLLPCPLSTSLTTPVAGLTRSLALGEGRRQVYQARLEVRIRDDRALPISLVARPLLA